MAAPVRTILFVLAASACGPAESVDSLGAQCVAYHANLQYAEAEQCYARAEALDPDDWRWTYYRALTRGARGDDEALASGMRQVVEKAPDTAAAWWRLGDAEFKRGRYERAEEAWRRAASMPDPAQSEYVVSGFSRTNPPAHTGRAPASAHARLGLARIALARQDADAARAMLEQVTASSPGFGPAFRLLADAYERLGRRDDAAAARARADRLPKHEPYVDPLVDALARESRNATFLLQQATLVDPAADAPWREYLLRRILELDPGHPDALKSLARHVQNAGRCDEALTLFERYRARQPDDVAVLIDIGACLSARGRYEEAEAALREGLRRGVDDAGLRYNLGVVLAARGRQAEALAEYERALQLDPNDAGARLNVAVALARQGRLDRAVRELERVIAIDPGRADAHTNLGVILAALGQRQRAADAFEAALNIDPRQEQAQAGLRELRP